MRALQLVVAALTASSFAQLALAQNTPADGASPAGSGGANNPALIGEVPDGPAPRLPDGTPDFSGVWVGGGPVGDISEGLLPGEEIVLLPAAKALMDSRMAADDPEARCLPTGVPRVAPYPWRIVQTPSHGKATHLFFLFEGNIHSFRQIFMDGRKHPDDLERRGTATPSAAGRAIRSSSRPWASTRSSGSTSKAIRTRQQLRTVERYTRTKFGELENVTTIYDAGAYAKPFTIKHTATLRPGWELMEYICNENNQDVEHIAGPAGL